MRRTAVVAVSLSALAAAIVTATLGVLPGLAAALVATVASAFLLREPQHPLARVAEVLRAFAQGDVRRRLYLGSEGEERLVNEALDELEAEMRLLTGDRTRLLVLLDELDEAILLVGEDHRVSLHNRAAARLFGRQELRGVHIFSALPEREVLRLLDEAEPGPARRRRFRLEGRSYEAAAQPLPGRGEVLLVVRDRTEEERLQRMRSDFVANASHELRTPLALLSGYAEALLDPEVSREEVRRFAEVIGREAARLARLIDDLLTLSQAEAQGSIPVEALLVAPCLARVLARILPKAAGRRIRLRLEGKLSARCLASAAALESVLLNLLDNAVRHSPEGGKVWVRVVARDGRVALQVVDEGEGIAPGELARIFERFYRVDKSHRRGGAGLGLAIARHLAEAMGGRITVQSELGKGSTFTLELACDEGEDEGGGGLSPSREE